jgi:hypothetical protein
VRPLALHIDGNDLVAEIRQFLQVGCHSIPCGVGAAHELALEFILDSLWNIEISADPIRHTEEGGDVVRQVRPTEEDVGIEINTFEWLLAHSMIFADKAPIRMRSRVPGFVPINPLLASIAPLCLRSLAYDF